MEAWAWLIAYLVGFALLQFVLYRYFRRGESTHDGEREPGHQRLEQRAVGSNIAETDGTDGVSCQRCGTRNDRTYSYCRNCVEPLR
jgi:hypothetical protein